MALRFRWPISGLGLSFGLGLLGEAADRHVVRLRRARRAAAVRDESFQDHLHFSDALGVLGSQVLGFAEIVGQVVQQHGRRWLNGGLALAESAAAGGRGDEFPDAAAQGRDAGHGTTDGVFADRSVLASQ